MAAVLLDTCAVIVMMSTRTMRVQARQAIVEAGTSDGIFVSAITAWEIGLLARRQRPGGLEFLPDAKGWMDRVMASPGFREAPFNVAIALGSSNLPAPFHDDPADRLLVTTARYMGLPIVTSDRRILAYGVAGHVQVVPC